MTHQDGSVRRPVFLAAAALACLVWLIFWPILGFQFVDFDVRQQLVYNPHVRDLSIENLKHIFTSRCVLSYYPVRTLTFAVDHQLWGLDPAGFKLTNVLIHLTNVLLVFWLILRVFRSPTLAGERAWKRSDVCVAALSAGLFAAHPVVVEPVAWVAGREELLMTLGALGCIHFHISARRLSQDGCKPRLALACHVAAAFCCAAACLSNAVAAVIPLLIVAWDLLTLPKPRLRRVLCGTWALWAIGVATVVIKSLGSSPELFAPQVAAFSVERLALVLNVYRLNLKTLVCPTQLTIEYPGLPARSLLDWQVVLGGIAVAATCGILWFVRRQTPILLGLAWFCLALGPTSQIMPHHVHRADRFLYLPLVGLAVAVAAGARPITNALKGRLTAVVVAALGLLSLLAVLSAGQVQTWRNSASMWEHCLRVFPDSVGAHSGLADVYAKAGRFDRAFEHHRIAVLKDPDNPNRLASFALFLAACDQKELRDYDLATQLAERACELTKRNDPAFVMALAEVHSQAGRPEMAVAAIEEAIALAESAGDAELTDELRGRLKRYRNRIASGSARQ